MTAEGVAPRRAALALINDVTIAKRLLAEAEARRLESLDPGSRARALRLAVTTLRWAGRADRVLGPYLRRHPGPETLNLLRLAVVEICQEGAAAHGVVNAAVTLAKLDPATQSRAGLVNAILRKVVRTPPDWSALPIPELPKWLRKPLVAAYGKQTVAAIEAVHAGPPPLDVTPKGTGGQLPAGTLLPTGSVRLAADVQVSALPGYDAGDWWVQDAAAAIPAQLLGARPGERVLDLCAAPGGKTLQLAAAGAHVTALDVSARRMARVTENLARTGLSAELVVADALDWAADPLDAVLLDAPCSATGTIRRHPDLPFAKGPEDIAPLVELQARLFDRAYDLLKPGGRMVFCTCSLLPEEGEDQVAAFLSRHPEVRVVAPELPGIDPAWIDGRHGLRLRPDFWADRGGMDGFYAALLQKPA